VNMNMRIQREKKRDIKTKTTRKYDEQ